MDIDSLEDLDTRGFVLVRGFLSETELQALRDDYAGAPLDVNANYSAKTPTSAAIEGFAARIDEVVAQVRRRTSIRVDLHVPTTSNYFAVGVTNGVSFPGTRTTRASMSSRTTSTT